MRTAVNQFMAPVLDLDEVAATARDLGLDGVGVFRPCLAELGAATVARVLGRAGLRATSVCVLFGLTGAGEPERRARLDDARAALRDAAALGAPLVVIAGGPGGRPVPGALDEFEDRFDALAAEADRAGVRLLLEPLHPALLHLSVLTSLREACRIAERYHHVGLVLDTWHVWAEPDLVGTARRHADRIDVVHLADRLPGPFTERRASPGDGVIDLVALGAALRDVLADPWWEVEVIDGTAAGPTAQRQLLRDAVRSARDHNLLGRPDRPGKEEACASPSSAARPAVRAR